MSRIKLPAGAAKSLSINIPGLPPRRRAARKPKAVRPDPPPLGSRVLALDVSSSATGMAVVQSGGRGPELIKCVVSRPSGESAPSRRVDEMIAEVVREATGLCSRIVVMELTDGARWKGRRRTNDLVQLAIAQGRFYEAFRSWGFAAFETVSATRWTRGIPKTDRVEMIRLMFPTYAEIHDPGLDGADAIELALWRLGL